MPKIHIGTFLTVLCTHFQILNQPCFMFSLCCSISCLRQPHLWSFKMRNKTAQRQEVWLHRRNLKHRKFNSSCIKTQHFTTGSNCTEGCRGGLQQLCTVHMFESVNLGLRRSVCGRERWCEYLNIRINICQWIKIGLINIWLQIKAKASSDSLNSY